MASSERDWPVDYLGIATEGGSVVGMLNGYLPLSVLDRDKVANLSIVEQGGSTSSIEVKLTLTF
jgi:hypothetical protein